MSKKSIITVLPKTNNKHDSEYYYLEIVGKFEKSEARHILERLDNSLYQQNMKVKILTTDSLGLEQFTNANIDVNKVVGYWIIPAFVDEELELEVESDEMNIILGGNILTLKVNQDLIKLINAKL